MAAKFERAGAPALPNPATVTQARSGRAARTAPANSSAKAHEWYEVPHIVEERGTAAARARCAGGQPPPSTAAGIGIL